MCWSTFPTRWSCLEAARDLLAPGGTVAFTFPNVDGWYPRATRRLIARRTGVWEYPELPVHLFDFSPRTASGLLARAGLTTHYARTTGVPFRFYRTTTLPPQLAHKGIRGQLLMAAFQALRIGVYPAAYLFGRGNAQFLLARAAHPPA